MIRTKMGAEVCSFRYTRYYNRLFYTKCQYLKGTPPGCFFRGRKDMKKICPKCRREYSELDNYCTKCGLELEKEENRCSEMKTQLCRHRVYADDDVYCSCCGALTTYALERERLRMEKTE